MCCAQHLLRPSNQNFLKHFFFIYINGSRMAICALLYIFETFLSFLSCRFYFSVLPNSFSGCNCDAFGTTRNNSFVCGGAHCEFSKEQFPVCFFSPCQPAENICQCVRAHAQFSVCQLSAWTCLMGDRRKAWSDRADAGR